eukprot:2623281-Rhodomonas_salina.1
MEVGHLPSGILARWFHPAVEKCAHTAYVQLACPGARSFTFPLFFTLTGDVCVLRTYSWFLAEHRVQLDRLELSRARAALPSPLLLEPEI